LKKNGISKSVVKRLPRYYRYLGELLNAGVERISSGELSKRMNVTASQIRQDLNNFGGFGQQGYGYNVRYLREEIGKILGLTETHNMIIIGAGRIGRALANYPFDKYGFHTIGIFDRDPELKDMEVKDLHVMMNEELPSFINSHHIDIAILAIPKESATEMAPFLCENGIKAFMNFSATDLNGILPKDVIVEHVHLSESLMKLSYNLNLKKTDDDDVS